MLDASDPSAIKLIDFGLALQLPVSMLHVCMLHAGSGSARCMPRCGCRPRPRVSLGRRATNPLPGQRVVLYAFFTAIAACNASPAPWFSSVGPPRMHFCACTSAVSPHAMRDAHHGCAALTTIDARVLLGRQLDKEGKVIDELQQDTAGTQAYRAPEVNTPASDKGHSPLKVCVYACAGWRWMAMDGIRPLPRALAEPASRGCGWALMSPGWALMSPGWALMSAGWALMSPGWALMSGGWALMRSRGAPA